MAEIQSNNRFGIKIYFCKTDDEGSHFRGKKVKQNLFFTIIYDEQGIIRNY